MTMQLIDREQFERIIDRYIDETGADTFKKDLIIDFLLDSEQVDAVPVVRCKDCRHYDEWAAGWKTYSGCALDDWNHRAQDDYCSYGERKSDNE